LQEKFLLLLLSEDDDTRNNAIYYIQQFLQKNQGIERFLLIMIYLAAVIEILSLVENDKISSSTRNEILNTFFSPSDEGIGIQSFTLI
jgi:hypothetical protein